MNGTLFLVGTPIGNPRDISWRAIDTLRTADAIACEEFREAKRLLRSLEITAELIEVNEHTERTAIEEIIALLRDGRDVALISDAGMPVIADPGSSLVRAAIDFGIPVTTIPGPTSIMSALALSGMDTERFFFYGFLSPKKEERRVELHSLRSFRLPIVFLDAPYRLNQVLEDLVKSFGGQRSACVACDLTLATEYVHRGSLSELLEHFTSHKKKCEFVIVVEGWREKRSAR